jgi:hypothetical protein
MHEVLSNTIKLRTYVVPHKLILRVHVVKNGGARHSFTSPRYVYKKVCYTWCAKEVTKWLDYVPKLRCLVEMPGAAVGCWGNEALFLHVLSFAHGNM